MPRSELDCNDATEIGGRSRHDALTLPMLRRSQRTPEICDTVRLVAALMAKSFAPASCWHGGAFYFMNYGTIAKPSGAHDSWVEVLHAEDGASSGQCAQLLLLSWSLQTH